MTREQIKNDVPELWRQRYLAGICPVCVKEKSQFEKGRKVYCSQDCADEYAKKFTSWSALKDKILKKDKETCQVCGLNRDKYRNIQIQNQNRSLEEWVNQNQDLIKHYRDKALIELDERFKRDFDNLMDDFWVTKNEIPYGESPKIRFSETMIELHVDHIKAIMNGGEMWDENNLRVLCGDCHKLKTKKDFERRDINRKKKGNADLPNSASQSLSGEFNTDLTQ